MLSVDVIIMPARSFVLVLDCLKKTSVGLCNRNQPLKQERIAELHAAFPQKSTLKNLKPLAMTGNDQYTNKAIEDLSDIWAYTEAHWSHSQTIIVVRTLHEKMDIMLNMG